MMDTFLDLTAMGETRHWLSRNLYLHVRLIFLSQWKAGADRGKKMRAGSRDYNSFSLQVLISDENWKNLNEIQDTEIKRIQETHIEWDVELKGDLLVAIGI